MQYQGHRCQALKVLPWLVVIPSAHIIAEFSFPDKPSLSQSPFISVPQQMFSHFYVNCERGTCRLDSPQTNSTYGKALLCGHQIYISRGKAVNEDQGGHDDLPSIPHAISSLWVRVTSVSVTRLCKITWRKVCLVQGYNPLINPLPTDQPH